MSFPIVGEPIEAIKEKLDILYNEFVERFVEFRGELTLYVKPERIVEICRTFRDNNGLAYNMLADLTAVDNLNNMRDGEPRFHVVYHLFSTVSKHRIRLKAPVVGEPPTIDSVTPVWCGANWHERECFDMFGIVFRGHPDLRRILMPEDWEGYPLRKDFPVADQEPYEYINKQLADE
ncbi:MAG: NADH-quinone oxidoreductase subunit C [Candidatus Omnitrophota bacterium]|jgi:NADH-quinone oxidoreductase subunit C|nr:MAG: NADH-quinone oxidoreductase subunit C [Candidatus Omnitrophota bacterium]